MPGQFLSDAERARMQAFPEEISRDDLGAFFTLSEGDWPLVNKRRDDANRLGYALMIGMVRHLGFVPTALGAVPARVREYVSSQLGLDANVAADYPRREQTRTEHLREIADHLGFRRASDDDFARMEFWLTRLALAHARPSVLLANLCEYLLRRRVLRPGITTLERVVVRARQAAEVQTYDALASLIEPRRQMLDELLEVDNEIGGLRLTWLRDRENKNSAPSIQRMLAKHAWLVDIGVPEWALDPLVHRNRLRYLARLGRGSTGQRLERMPGQRKYPILVAFLQQSLVDIVDEILDMFDRRIGEALAKARRVHEGFSRKRTSVRDDIVRSYRAIVRVLRDPKVSNPRVRKVIFKKIAEVELARLYEETAKDARVLDPQGLDFIAKQYGTLRKFSVPLLEQMRLHPDPDSSPEAPVLRALRAIRDASRKPGNRLPSEVPTDFLSPRWKRLALKGKKVHRANYEIAALTELRSAVKAGDIWVEHSRRHASPGSYVMPVPRWNEVRDEALDQLGVPANADAALDTKTASLEALRLQVGGAALRVDNERHVVPPVEKEPEPASLVELRRHVTERLPQVDLSTLLVEVDRWTNFGDLLVDMHSERPTSGGARTRLHAAILAQACNLGFTEMAHSSSMTFEQLAWVSRWHLRPVTLKSAFSTVVDFQHKQSMAHHWGTGSLSSSDGQRFPVSGSVREARAQAREFGLGRGVTFYTSTSDQFSQYGIKVIPTTARDATYILDEILDNETELEILEHTADTHGYTDLIFALFDLLGLRFAPRIADTGGTRIYALEGVGEEFTDELPTARTIRREPIVEHWPEMLRIAGSLKLGWVTASLLVSKLQARTRRGVVRALLEYGRICKTEHVLRYLAEEDFRRRIGRQLNKGEALHALRRHVAFGRRGRLTRKDAEGLLNQAACLNLVSNAIVAWNTVYLDRVIHALRTEGVRVQDEDIARLSPVRHGHVHVLGKYRFDDVPAVGCYRELGAPS